MRNFTYLVIIVTQTVFISCQNNSKIEKSQRFDYASDIGVAVINSNNKACLDITNSALVSGSLITLISLSKPQSFAEAEIVGKTDSTCSDTDMNDENEAHYEIKVIKGSGPEPQTPAIAVCYSQDAFAINNEHVYVDLDDDGQPEFFRSCASSEGLHLTVWSGKPLDGKRQWHRYYYLGYDLDADCTYNEMDNETDMNP